MKTELEKAKRQYRIVMTLSVLALVVGFVAMLILGEANLPPAVQIYLILFSISGLMFIFLQASLGRLSAAENTFYYPYRHLADKANKELKGGVALFALCAFAFVLIYVFPVSGGVTSELLAVAALLFWAMCLAPVTHNWEIFWLKRTGKVQAGAFVREASDGK